ncbi:2454_t:CDS:1, partial [Acaulospora colombiana]
MSRNPTKPVNDLIKFWASQQEESKKSKATEKIPQKSRPLSPNVSIPSSPQTTPQQPSQAVSPRLWNSTDVSNNVSSSIIPPLTSALPLLPSSTLFDDFSTEKPVSISDRLFGSELENSNSNNTVTLNKDSVPDSSFSIIDLKHVSGHKERGRMDWGALEQHNPTPLASSSSTSPNSRSPAKPLIDTSFLSVTRDLPKARETTTRKSLPPVMKVSNLVSKFEKVASPPTSPTALSPTNKFNQIPDPLSLEKDPMSPTDGHVKRLQPIIEPLFMPSRKRNIPDDEVESLIATSQLSTSPPSSKEKNKKSAATGIIVNVSSTQTYSTITSPVENYIRKESVVSRNIPGHSTSPTTQVNRDLPE